MTAPESAFGEQMSALSALIRLEYVSADVATVLGDAVDDWRGGNRFSGLTEQAFAAAATEGLRKIAHDEHLVLAYAPGEHVPQPPPTNVPRPKTPANCPPERLGFLQAMKFGVRNVEIKGEIGVLACDFFPPPFEETRVVFDAAMEEVRTTRGLVIDLTNNRGGHPEMTAYLLSYFFDRPEFPITIFRGRHWPDDSTRTTHMLGGPNYGEARPLAIAISSNTFSGGEEFAYTLQATRRATIVGETSRGGANIGMNYPLPGGFRVFIPVGAPVNAITGSNWEGTGVKPDTSAPADNAVAVAIETMRMQLA